MASTVRRRSSRQDVIREIVRREPVRTQRALVEHLQARGYECTQATVSRDITEMGLQKQADGTYALPEDLRLRRMAADLVTDVRRAGNLVVIHTADGSAQSVAAAFDAVGLPGALGSVAGDDTILVICADDARGARLMRLVKSLMSPETRARGARIG